MIPMRLDMSTLMTAGALVIGLIAVPNAVGDGPQAGPPSTFDGSGLYRSYCASCHGPSGRGDGPAGDEFRRRPADLTQFAKKNGGVFNAALIHRSVDGRSVKAHGSTEMPVWGDAFKWRLGLDEDAIRERVEAIVRYVGSIQERSGH